MVIGGLGVCNDEGDKKYSDLYSCSTKAEILPLPNFEDLSKAIDGNLESIISWGPLPNLNHPHAYMPAVGNIENSVYVVGGGDFFMSELHQKVKYNNAPNPYR